ncbi:hypothetical protein [Plantibacter sp. YIM 135249]|uniref:hypothetical protein n=1 Tax=Plantibacter sp. YIM 135249 TaxID=3423918 RepID=UPI003D33D4FC
MAVSASGVAGVGSVCHALGNPSTTQPPSLVDLPGRGTALTDALLSGIPYAIAGGTYLNDDRGVALFLHRSERGIRPWRLILGYLLLTLILVSAPVLLGPLAWVYLLGASIAVAATSGQALGASLELAFAPPKRPYWTVQSLGKDPRSPSSGFLFAAQVVRNVVPAGDIVVVVAGDDKLARVYERFGFIRHGAGSLLLSARR